MNTTLIKGGRAVGKSRLAYKFVENKTAKFIYDDEFDLMDLVNYEGVVIDDLEIHNESMEDILKFANRIIGGELIVITSDESFEEKGFDNVFKLI